MERKNEVKKTAWQIVKFAIVGVLNTLVDFAVFQTLNLLLGWVYVAQVIGYSCGIINSYLWNSNWTFREQRTRGPLIRGATPGYHIGRDGPGRAAEADEARPVVEAGPHAPYGLDDRLQAVRDGGTIDLGEAAAIRDRFEARSFALDEPQLLAESLRDDEDVGEQDRSVEAEAANRLERDLGSKLGIVAQRQEAAGLGPDLAILGQIAPGLTHQPDRGNLERLAGQCAQKGGRFAGLLA